MEEEMIRYIERKIVQINATNFDIDAEGKRIFGSKTNLKDFMKKYFIDKLQTETYQTELLQQLKTNDYKKSKIVNIANAFKIAKSDLESFYDTKVIELIDSKVTPDEYANKLLELYEAKNNDNIPAYKFSKIRLKKFILKQKHFIGKNGFLQNITNINSGIMTANAGDSAQFLFLARAILAGYNCSNVDVRSSRYDAVIDIFNNILRIQVKGISGGVVIFPTLVTLKSRVFG